MIQYNAILLCDAQANPCLLAGQSGASQGMFSTSTVGGSIWVNVYVQQVCISSVSIKKQLNYITEHQNKGIIKSVVANVNFCTTVVVMKTQHTN